MYPRGVKQNDIGLWIAAALFAGGAGYGLYWWWNLGREDEPDALPPPGEVPPLLTSEDYRMRDEIPSFPHKSVGPNLYLRTDAADAWGQMVLAAKADGVDLPISTAYRSIAWQTELRAKYEAFLAGGPWAPLAAKPDGNGPHQRGRAVDLHGLNPKKPNYNPIRAAWLKANAERFGWYNTGLTFSMVENWHWYFKGAPQFPVLVA